MRSAVESSQDQQARTTDRLAIRDCGLADYREVLALQQQLQEQRRDGQITDTVLIVEHPPVITLGARKSANKLLVGPDELARRGIDLVEIRRGGGATAHNPGQLVFYPILHLQELRLDINQYVRTLEAIGIELLSRSGRGKHAAQRVPGALGGREEDRFDRGPRVAFRDLPRHGHQHSKRLEHLQSMVPCGLDGVQMTSVQKETGQTA